MSDWELVKPETSKVRNQIKNPSLEASVNNWTASGGTFTRSTEQSYEGAYSGKFVAGAASVNVKSNGVNVTNGQSVAAAVVTYRGDSTPQGTATIYDATNAAVRASSTITASGSWELHQMTWTNSTGGTVSVEIRVTNSTADSASIIYFDAAMLTYTSYNILWFDGDRDGCKWVGTRHESVSDMLPFSVSGGRVYDLQDAYSFKVTRAIGAGNAPVITNVLPYAIAPGGTYQNTGVGVRDWALTGVAYSSSPANLHSVRRALQQELNANRFGQGAPVLIRYTGSSSTRQIRAFFNGGLEDMNAQYIVETIAPRFVSTEPFFESPNRRATVLNTATTATMKLIIAKIDGLWNVLGPPHAAGTYTNITAIASAPDGKIYIGGDFLNFDNQATGDYLAYYDKVTDTWGVVSALNSSVLAIVVDGAGIVYFGGSFTNAGGVAAADNIAQWDGVSVTAVGTPNTGTASITSVNALAFDGQGRLWVGGVFTDFGNVGAADRVCYWDGSAYYALGSGLNGACNALAYSAVGDKMYIGGEFSSAGGVANTTKACYWDWTLGAFVALGSGVKTVGAGSNNVYALAVDAVGGVYIGGTFDTINGIDCPRVGYWNGTTARSLGTGIDGNAVTPAVLTIAINEIGEVWIGGQFDEVNGVAILDNMMTVWNGSTFRNAEIDLPGTAFVNAILWDGEDVYIGGTSTGTVTYSNTTTVTNNGTEPSNPVFYFKRTGGTSAKLVHIENTTTRKKIILNYDLLNGEEIKIDLRPGRKRITSRIKGRGSNTLNVGSDLNDFVIVGGSAGTNVLAVMMVNVGSPTIPATVEFDELFMSFD